MERIEIKLTKKQCNEISEWMIVPTQSLQTHILLALQPFPHEGVMVINRMTGAMAQDFMRLAAKWKKKEYAEES